MLVATLLAHGGNGHHQHHHQQGDQYHSQQGIGLHQHTQVALLQRLEAGVVERCTLYRIERREPRLDKVHCHKHARQRPDGVERLGQVQAPCGRLAVTHEQDIGVSRGLQEGQAAREDEISNQEGPKAADAACRDEQQHAQRI